MGEWGKNEDGLVKTVNHRVTACVWLKRSEEKSFIQIVAEIEFSAKFVIR